VAREQSEKNLAEVEKDHILHKVRGYQSRAAKVLVINRRTRFNKIRQHDIFTRSVLHAWLLEQDFLTLRGCRLTLGFVFRGLGYSPDPG
jgi:hypothetical protein